MRTTPARTRPLVLYVALVFVPTAILVGLSLQSLRREVRAVRQLTAVNRELLAQQLGMEMERSAKGQIEECLHSADPHDPEAALAVCPIASKIFLFENGRLLYPKRSDDLDGLLDDLRFMPPQPAGKIRPLAYIQGGPAQFLYMRLYGSPPNRMLAVRLNLDYVASRDFPVVRSRMGIAAQLAVRRGADDPCSGCFRELFPFWTIAANGREGDAALQPGLTLLGILNVATMLALSLSVWQLFRVYRRHWRAAEIRAKFVSGFSHELKPPLANIRLYAELLSSGNNSSPAGARHAEVIVSQADQLTSKVNNVLNAALIDQGRRRYELREADLHQVVSQTIERYRNWVEQQGFTLESGILAVGPVLCDPDAVSETLVGLLENAIKYSDRSRVVRIALRQEGDFAVIEVEDRGFGIPLPEREKIFEEFYRAPNAKVPGGFGLGLFLAQHAMRAQGGSVEVESEPGHGSRFRLRFPTAPHAHDTDR